jgi:hypothetical protein
MRVNLAPLETSRASSSQSSSEYFRIDFLPLNLGFLRPARIKSTLVDLRTSKGHFHILALGFLFELA